MEKKSLAMIAKMVHVTVLTPTHNTMARHASHPRLAANPLGYYSIFWTDNGRSKRKSTGTKDLAEAELKFSEWLRHRRVPNVVGKDWNISELLDIYFQEQIEDGPSHERTAIIVATLKRAFGTASPDTLDASAILRYGRERAQGLHGKRAANDSTVRRELTVLIACLNHAVRQRRMQAASFPHIERPSDGEARDVVIPMDHLAAILDTPNSRLKNFITIAYETASRRAAVESLCWRQVDLERALIDFSDGKTRSVKRRVAVPMSTKLLEHMKSLRSMIGGTRGGYILGTNDSIYPAWIARMEHLAKTTGNKAFLDYNPHDLRRTWATNAARRGVSLFNIAGILGDSVAVVTKHYAKHHPDYLRGAVE
ncbi:XerC Integrase [uncultured Caudovirales phage]|uniref:XerC Integrase n=1 Tax=uncultured Caudovirales phage TaxID=2100421 RepID=A0A6J5NWX9_9CAUD|nr:XerC Integrase [uncultured Caudovirales phage]